MQMNRAALIIAPLLLCASLSAQTSLLRGLVLFQNSGGRPAAGVQISAFGANSCYTTDAGMFELAFPKNKPGDKVRVIVGGRDKSGASIEVVNYRELDLVFIPSDPNVVFEIIVCPTGQRDAVALRLYNILAQVTQAEYQKQIASYEQLLARQKLSEQAAESYRQQIKQLEADRDEALKKVEEQALFIASINLDRASAIVKEAVLMIEQEENVQKALKMLQEAPLEEAYQAALDQKNKAEAEILQVMEAYRLKASLLVNEQKHEDAIACYLKMIDISLTNKLDVLELAYIYYGLGISFMAVGKQDQSLEANLKALKIREENLNPDHPSVIRSVLAISLNYKLRQDLPAAKSILVQKIEFLEKNIPESRALSELYERLASLSMQERDYPSAYGFLEKAIAILERSEWPDPFLVSIMYHKMGAMANSQKDFPKAIQSYEKCASLTRQIIAEGNMSRVPTIFYDLGKLYDMQGDKEKAIGCYEEQLAMIDSFPNPPVNMIINSCQELGNYFTGKKDFRKAAGYFLQGAQLLESRGAEYEQTVAGFYSNAANSFSYMKQYQTALEYQLKAIAIQERIELIPMRLAHGYTQIAYAYYNTGDYANALAYHQKALVIRKAGLPAGDMAISFNNNDIALTYLALGDLPQALDIQQRNIAQAEQAAGPDNPFLGTSYNHLGLILAHMGRWEEAEQALNRAELLAPNSFLLFRNRAVLYALQGKKEEAISQIRKGIGKGYKDPAWLQTEKAFDALRGEKDFQDLMKELER